MAVQLLIKRHPAFTHIANYSTKFARELEYKKCYKILGVNEDSDQEEIRTAYLRLVKKYHPDSGHEEADADKFHEIDTAFRKLIDKKSRERWDVEEKIVSEQDIKHTAPQHRQYLSYDGVGSGTPFQRQKQYIKVRAMHAAENVYNHRMSKVTADEKSLMNKTPQKHDIKTKYGFDRLVEDLIQESISKGEFNNLKGVGKPLPSHQNRNPYVDFITHKLNEVLIENGFTPEWITLQKEIREAAHHLRTVLFYERQAFGPFPLNVEENISWSETVYKHQKTVDDLNKKIAKFNLVVPVLDKQMLQISLEKEAQRAMTTGKSFKTSRVQIVENNVNTEDDGGNLLSILERLFKGK